MENNGGKGESQGTRRENWVKGKIRMENGVMWNVKKKREARKELRN